MGTYEYPWIPQYSRVPTRVWGGHEYHIYPTGRGRVSYYPYPWVPIDIPNHTCKFYINKKSFDMLLRHNKINGLYVFIEHRLS